MTIDDFVNHAQSKTTGHGYGGSNYDSHWGYGRGAGSGSDLGIDSHWGFGRGYGQSSGRSDCTGSGSGSGSCGCDGGNLVCQLTNLSNMYR